MKAGDIVCMSDEWCAEVGAQVFDKLKGRVVATKGFLVRVLWFNGTEFNVVKDNLVLVK